jgi:hypothetical protein
MLIAACSLHSLYYEIPKDMDDTRDITRFGYHLVYLEFAALCHYPIPSLIWQYPSLPLQHFRHALGFSCSASPLDGWRQICGRQAAQEGQGFRKICEGDFYPAALLLPSVSQRVELHSSTNKVPKLGKNL